MAALGVLSHPRCTIRGMGIVDIADNPFLGPGDSPRDRDAEDLKAEFLTMIRWHEEFDPRSMQVALGPSDLGTECERRLAYKVAGIPGFHRGDPWAAFVGSAIHAAIEDVIRRYAREYGGHWLIEGRIQVDPNIAGRADLVHDDMVIDIKTASPDVMKQLPTKGPRKSYLSQIHSYAKGLNDNGRLITKVGFIFVPRSGRLDDTYTWVDDYRPEIAEAAIARPYRIAGYLRDLDILNRPERWEMVPATPDFLHCQYCPLFNSEWGSNEPATDKGCAGWKMNKKEKK